MGTAIVTGASRGLGRALAAGLAAEGWNLVLDARGEGALAAAADELQAAGGSAARGSVVGLAGSITDPAHRRALVVAARELGGLDLLVNNAGALGPSPQPTLDRYPLDVFADVLATNVTAQLGVIQEALPLLSAATSGRILNVTSDAAVEGYEGWGGYGASKAALEQLSRVLAAEQPAIRVWWVDPGDLRTQMHQEAFPGEDISDRPLPETVVPALLDLIVGDRPSGRYRAAELAGAPA